MTPSTVTLYEHQSRSYAEAGLYPNDLAARERLLDAIERLNAASGQEVLHLGRKTFCARSLVGLLRVGEITFEILPKIDEQPRSGSAEGKGPQPTYGTARNLLAMLSYAGSLRIHTQETAALDTSPSAWFELLTRLFAADLVQQLRAGLPLAYRTREERLPVLRGRWDVQHQITHYPAGHQHFSVIYDDLTSDTPLAQVFRLVVERLLPLSADPENRRLLNALREWLSPVSLLPEIPMALLESIHFDRMNERCRPAFQFARLFLSASAPRLTAGSVPACAFVFDMNALFERFVAAFLERHRRSVLPSEWQEANIIAQSERMPLYLARSAGQNAFRLRPDLLLAEKGSNIPLLIADTKYKQLSAGRGKLEIAPEDVYQMLAYSVRLKSDRLLLLYPQAARASSVFQEYHIEGATTRLFVATLNLHAPLDKPAALVKEMREIFTGVAAGE